MRNPAPLELDAVLDPSWLTEALDLTDDVTEVEVVEVLRTVATKVRFRAATKSGGVDSLCVAVTVTAAAKGLAAIDADKRICLVHGDFHAGNVYVDGSRPGLIDWQVAHVGHWATDIAYHIAAVLDIDDRRKHERDLLDA